MVGQAPLNSSTWFYLAINSFSIRILSEIGLATQSIVNDLYSIHVYCNVLLATNNLIEYVSTFRTIYSRQLTNMSNIMNLLYN